MVTGLNRNRNVQDVGRVLAGTRRAVHDALDVRSAASGVQMKPPGSAIRDSRRAPRPHPPAGVQSDRSDQRKHSLERVEHSSPAASSARHAPAARAMHLEASVPLLRAYSQRQRQEAAWALTPAPASAPLTVIPVPRLTYPETAIQRCISCLVHKCLGGLGEWYISFHTSQRADHRRADGGRAVREIRVECHRQDWDGIAWGGMGLWLAEA